MALPESRDISWRTAFAIAAFLSTGSIATNLLVNYPWDVITRMEAGEIIYNVGLFSIIQFVATVGILKGLPKISPRI
jgi:DNA-binding transcriptional regulator WhiA